MNYPLPVYYGTIQSDVENKHIQTESFKTWQDNTIFASGLELNINLGVNTLSSTTNPLIGINIGIPTSKSVTWT